jgi:hypothetical protein
MSKQSHWTLLTKSLPAVSIDPLTEADIAQHVLLAGTLVNHALVALAKAEKDGADQVIVEARTEAGWISFERVGVTELRAAIK